jgi:hypothetical protein
MIRSYKDIVYEQEEEDVKEARKNELEKLKKINEQRKLEKLKPIPLPKPPERKILKINTFTYDDVTVKPQCVDCGVSLGEDFEAQCKNYEKRGNFCGLCSGSAQ